MKHIKRVPQRLINLINNLNLRSDLESNNIYDTYLEFAGYVGNRTATLVEDEYHEDDMWAIDCKTADGMTVESYLYTSEFEYNQDVELLTELV